MSGFIRRGIERQLKTHCVELSKYFAKSKQHCPILTAIER
jgi:hypothetical protein